MPKGIYQHKKGVLPSRSIDSRKKTSNSLKSSEKFQAKIREIHENPEARLHMKESATNSWEDPIIRSRRNIARNAVMSTDEYKKNMSSAMSGRIVTEKGKENMSEAAIKRLQDSSFRYRGAYYSKKNDMYIQWMSSYELKAFEKLESDSTYASYEYETLRIPVTIFGKNRYTLLDIVAHRIDGKTELIEVKAEWNYNFYEETRIKIEAVKKYAVEHGYLFSLWMEDELRIRQ